VLLSQSVPQLGIVKQRRDGKNTSSYTHGARQPCVYEDVFLPSHHFTWR